MKLFNDYKGTGGKKERRKQLKLPLLVVMVICSFFKVCDALECRSIAMEISKFD